MTVPCSSGRRPGRLPNSRSPELTSISPISNGRVVSSCFLDPNCSDKGTIPVRQVGIRLCGFAGAGAIGEPGRKGASLPGCRFRTEEVGVAPVTSPFVTLWQHVLHGCCFFCSFLRGGSVYQKAIPQVIQGLPWVG